MRDVVITGMGMVSPKGLSIQENWNAHINGDYGISPFSEEYPVPVLTLKQEQIDSIKTYVADIIGRKQIRRRDVSSLMGLYAAAQAVEFAGGQSFDPYRSQVSIGTSLGGLRMLQDALYAYHDRQRVNMWALPGSLTDNTAELVAEAYNIRGGNQAIAKACASIPANIAHIADQIRGGRIDAGIAGGVSAIATEEVVSAFDAMRGILADYQGDASAKPFDENRTGLVLAEGAGMFLLEEKDHALQRGAAILAEIRGYGTTSDAYHMIHSDPTGHGLYIAMRSALEASDMSPHDLDFILSHGTGTYANDITEALAFKALYGLDADMDDYTQFQREGYPAKGPAADAYIEAIEQLPVHAPVISYKEAGHDMAASGKDIVYGIISLHTGMIPPLHNTTDPIMGMPVVHGSPLCGEFKIFAKTALGLGGNNVAMVFNKPQYSDAKHFKNEIMLL